MASLNHIEIYVSDLDQTRQFWEWLFRQIGGWTLYQEFNGGFSYKHGELYLVFVQAQAKHLAAGYHRGRVGLNHLAFSAPDRAHVDNLMTMLQERNVSILYADQHPNPSGKPYAVYFEDPDRIKVEYVTD